MGWDGRKLGRNGNFSAGHQVQYCTVIINGTPLIAPGQFYSGTYEAFQWNQIFPLLLYLVKD